jgi:hypothetical protein
MRLYRWAGHLEIRYFISFRLEFYFSLETPEPSLNFMHSPIQEGSRTLSQEVTLAAR